MENWITGVGYVFRHRFRLYGMPVFLKFQPHERVFYDIFAPGAIGEMGLHYTKLEKMARSAVIQQKTIAKHYVAAGTNSLSYQ